MLLTDSIHVHNQRFGPTILAGDRQLAFHLIGISNGNYEPEIVNPTQGRSVEFRVDGKTFKTKGLIGYQDGGLIERFPQVEIFVVDGGLHPSFDENMQGAVVTGSKKFAYSMTLDASRNEYEIAKRLSAIGLAREPVCYGELSDQFGHPELDGLGRKTGFVVLRTSSDEGSLPHDVDFEIFLNSEELTRRTKEPEGRAKILVMIEKRYELVYKIGKIRALAVKNNIFRHVGHFGNFVYNSKNEEILLSDLDSCLIGDLLSEQARGVALVRQIASDLVRLSTITCFDFNGGRELFFRANKINLFERYFKGLSDGLEIVRSRNKLDIIQRSVEKVASYLSFSKEKLERAFLRKAFASSQDRSVLERARFNLEYAPLWATALYCAFKFVQASPELRKSGMLLPALSDGELGVRISGVVKEYISKTQECVWKND